MKQEYKPTIIDKIRWFYRDNIKYFHKDFANGVSNLWKWFPVIWKDRNWDHSFIYEILKFKLTAQADYIGTHYRHTRAGRDAEIMMLVTKLIQRCQDDFYDSEYMDYHESKFEFLDVTEDDDLPEKYRGKKRLEIEVVSERFDEYFKKYPRQYKRVVSGEVNRLNGIPKNKKRIAMEIAHENQVRCRQLAFKIIADRIEGWWD